MQAVSQKHEQTHCKLCVKSCSFNVGGDTNEILMDHTHIPEATLHKALNSIVIVTKSFSVIRKMSNPGIDKCVSFTHTGLCSKRDLQKAVEKYF